MLLHKTHDNPAVMGGVTNVGEFRIRNSAKAFNILSSGLYSNKIRAIIRELSCNAVDSHVAAGNTDQFEVHLPTVFEPYFAVRDWGTGLTHQQIIDIYTTYFESTKTASNEFIGALGLGSKSPFSYTDNFTVTAVRDGRRGVYSAYINDDGIPSIVLMSEDTTDEPNGVEVRFAVDKTNEFYNFRSEAEQVFRWFKNPPRITGASCNIRSYRDDVLFADIAPGVHGTSGYQSYAIMGNIGYRIEVPDAHQTLGEDLAALLHCGLIIEFAIGELDFQASREHLSYIPATINAIRAKLKDLKGVLHSRMNSDLAAIPNEWDRTAEFDRRWGNSLWRAVAESYSKNYPVLGRDSRRLVLTRAVLEDHNISVLQLTRSYNNNRYRAVAPGRGSFPNAKTPANETEFVFRVSTDVRFVVNDDARRLQFSQLNYHSEQNVPGSAISNNQNCEAVYVLNRLDPSQPTRHKELFALMFDPPASQITNRAELLTPPRTATTKVQGKILRLVRNHNRRSGEDANFWDYHGVLGDMDDTETYYYLPLRNRTVVSKVVSGSGSDFFEKARGTGLFKDLVVYGVPVSSIDDVEEMPNWVNFETHVRDTLAGITAAQVDIMVAGAVDRSTVSYFGGAVRLLDEDHPLRQFIKPVPKTDLSIDYIISLQELFNGKSELTKKVAEARAKLQEVVGRYPLLACLNYSAQERLTSVAEYIKLIDDKSVN